MTIETDVDPVCGVPVDANEAREHDLAIDFEQREYVFCGKRCKSTFVARPTAYAVAGRTAP